MRALIVALAVVLFVTTAGDVDAKTKRSHQQAKPTRQAASLGRSSDYIVHNADKLPIGSADWWGQMLREGRAGTCCN